MYRVVIADDEHLIRSSLKKRVDEHDHLVTAAAFSNGSKCLEWLEQHYADICITDVRMPVMDGLELSRQISEKYPWMVTIVMSSYDDFVYVQECLRIGTIDYILKPIEQEVLYGVLAKATRKLQHDRKEKASIVLLSKLPYFRDQLDQWVMRVQTMQQSEMQLLIVDTLEMFESWDKDAWYFLDALAQLWIDLVWNELSRSGIPLEAFQLSYSEPKLEWLMEKLEHQSSRLLAIGWLEQSATMMLKAIQLKDKGHSYVIEKVKLYLEQHFADKINLQEVADTFAVSRTYLSFLFKQETGVTIWNYLKKVRMEKAKDLLLDTPYKCYEVAQSVGYEDSIHFSKLFKGYYGLNPMEYKKRVRGISHE